MSRLAASPFASRHPHTRLAALCALALGTFLLAACQNTTAPLTDSNRSPPKQTPAEYELVYSPPPAPDLAPVPAVAPVAPVAPPMPNAAIAQQRPQPLLESIEVTGSRVGGLAAENSGQIAYRMPPGLAPSSIADHSNRDNYAEIQTNGILRVAEQPVSTFSIDVDTGSYSNIRSLLRVGQRPPKDAVRIEELINYFSYSYPAPQPGAAPFAVHSQLAPSPFNPKRLLLQVGLQAQQIEAKDLPPANLVFLIDSSGSMQDAAKLPLLKRGFALLVEQLRPQDSVAIVTYAGSAGLVLPPTAGDRQLEILAALERLEAGGSTNGGAGIELAYRVAAQAKREGGINRVILATDGDFNVGTVNQRALETLVADQRASGIALSTLGFGRGNYNDAMAERLADVGNGNHAYIDSILEARKVLVAQMGGTLHTLASDVKIQVEFNPAVVAEYRLLGYENRLLAREDFDNDRVDAGEIGAGHSVTALYELALVGSGGEASSGLRYADAQAGAARSKADELGLLRLRYKRPGESSSQLIESPMLRSQLRRVPGENLGFAAAVAGFGELLRGGEHAGQLDFDGVAKLARDSCSDSCSEQQAEFMKLVGLARGLMPAQDAATAAKPEQPSRVPAS